MKHNATRAKLETKSFKETEKKLPGIKSRHRVTACTIKRLIKTHTGITIHFLFKKMHAKADKAGRATTITAILCGVLGSPHAINIDMKQTIAVQHNIINFILRISLLSEIVSD